MLVGKQSNYVEECRVQCKRFKKANNVNAQYQNLVCRGAMPNSVIIFKNCLLDGVPTKIDLSQNSERTSGPFRFVGK